jgi:FMN-dependent dehydrogenase
MGRCDSPRWFQLYWPKDPALAVCLVERAERAGFRVVVVTLDTYLLGWRERDLQLAWLPFVLGQGIANYLTDPAFRAALPAPVERDPGAAVIHQAEGVVGAQPLVGAPNTHSAPSAHLTRQPRPWAANADGSIGRRSAALR